MFFTKYMSLLPFWTGIFIENEIFNISRLILTKIESLFLGTHYDTVHGPNEASQTGLQTPSASVSGCRLVFRDTGQDCGKLNRDSILQKNLRAPEDL